MKHQILLVPDGWPANFFYEQMDVVSDLFEFQVLLGIRVSFGKKVALKKLIHREYNSFSIERNEISRINYSYINHLPLFLYKIQWEYIMKRLNMYILSLFDGKKPDLIHIQQISDTAVFICEWAKKNGVPVVMSEHLLFVRHQMDDFQHLKEKVYGNVDLVLCASNYQYRTLLTNDIKMKKVDIIGNLLVTKYIPNKFININNNRNIVFIASHLGDKDIDVLLEAVRILKERGFTDFQVDVIGITPGNNYENGDKADYNLQEEIELLHLSSLIHIKGKRNRQDLLENFRDYSFLVSTSLSETFGVSVAEAIMNGLPVVCTDSGGVRDFVDKTNGIIVPIRNANVFADAMVEMFDRRIDYDAIQISGKIIERFGSVAFREKLLEVYNGLLDIPQS
jgi:glycosyltransferase involved in cell wall biosynthesis